MTIDERLERLAARHEALAQSVELLTHDVRELRAGVDELRLSVDELRLGVADLKAIAEASLRNINALAGIAENHERRITRLEGGE